MQTLPDYATIAFDGFSETISPNHIRTEFDDGYIRQDGKVRSPRTQRKVTIYVCNRDDLNAFKCWWNEDLRNGSRFFLWQDPLSNKQIRTRFVGDIDVTPKNKVLSGTKFAIGATLESWDYC